MWLLCPIALVAARSAPRKLAGKKLAPLDGRPLSAGRAMSNPGPLLMDGRCPDHETPLPRSVAAPRLAKPPRTRRSPSFSSRARGKNRRTEDPPRRRGDRCRGGVHGSPRVNVRLIVYNVPKANFAVGGNGGSRERTVSSAARRSAGRASRSSTPPGNIFFASSSPTAGTMITSSPCFQFTGVATLCFAVSCIESRTRRISSKFRPVVIG